jgi:hypothetical protein
MKRSPIPTLGLLAIVLGGCASAMRANPVPVAPEVLDTFRAQDSVAVVVVLVTPNSYYRGDRNRLRGDIAHMQDEVENALEPGQYRELHRFQSVPALTLMLYDEAAIRTLARLKHVQRLGLDDGSGGGETP